MRRRRKLYQLPEQVCRNLPDELPDASEIKIVGTDPLRPLPNEPTASGIHFVTNSGKIVLQGIAAAPHSDPEARRELLYFLADYRDSRPMLFDRDMKRVERFLIAIGGQRVSERTAGPESTVEQWRSAHDQAKQNSEQVVDLNT